MKKILVLGLVLMAFTANAQFKMGVGGGINYSKFSGSDVNFSENIIGFNAGFLMEVKLPSEIGFEGDVLFSSKGSGTGANNLRLTYIDMPVVMKVYLLKVLSLQIGGQYSVLVKASSSGTDLRSRFEDGDVSAVLGAGIDGPKFHLSGRYNYGLTSIDINSRDIKNNMFTLTVGFWVN